MRIKIPAPKECVFAALFTIVLTNISVFGQIKIPDVFKPKQSPPTQGPTKPNVVMPTAGQPASISKTAGGNYVDDGFTWFEAVGFQEYVNGAPVTLGWALKSSIRLIGEFPKRSAFKMVVARAGKPVTSTRCEGYPTNSNGVSFLWAVECWKKDTATKEIGKFDVQVFAINGDTDAETLVRTYKIDVLEAARVRGGTTNSTPDAPHYYISRHAEAPVSFLFLRPRLTFSYVGWGDRSPTKDANTVEIYYNLSPTKEGKGVPHGYLRCSVDGKRLEMPGPQPYADQAVSSTDRRYEVIYTDRLAAQYKAGTEFRDPVEFTQVRLVLPLTFGEGRNTNRLSMGDYPGRWECSLMNNGEAWRTWRWNVGRDGMPEMHAEQRGNVNLFYNTYLIDTEIPAAGTILDKRLVPISLTEGLFYGHKWTTAEGKAMAAKVPTKGSPAPIPSNKIK
ncbi:MAG: hypothetical protein ABL959_00340 [Pyrinomonadaceae bacterium]